jgi:hypothetical protein
MLMQNFTARTQVLGDFKVAGLEGCLIPSYLVVRVVIKTGDSGASSGLHFTQKE